MTFNDDRGLLIKEEDLKEAMDKGEVSVGYKGCSLFLKVLFGIMEDGIPEDSDSRESRDKGEEEAIS